MGNVIVADVMTRNPVFISPYKSIVDCAKLMVKKRVGGVPIVDKKKLVGFISQKDILWAMIKKHNKDLEEIKVIDISPKKIVIIKANSTVEECIKKMKQTKFERFPVISKKELVGIVTVRDILNFKPELYPELDEFNKIKEESQKLVRITSAQKRRVKEGMCEECGKYGILSKVNGLMVCEDCKENF